MSVEHAGSETIGTYLKRQRNIRKIDLVEVARVTKIHPRQLEALENDQLEALPGVVFMRGFVHSYAKAIGLNSDDALLQLEDYLKQNRNAYLQHKERVSWLKPFGKKTNPYLIFGIFFVVLFLVYYFQSR